MANILDKFLNLFKKKEKGVKKMNTKTGIAAENSAVSTVYKVVVFIVLVVYALMMFFFLYWAIINSFKSYDQFTYDPMGLPSAGTIEAFLTATVNKRFLKDTIEYNLLEHAKAIKFGNFVAVFKHLRIEEEIGYFTFFSDKAVRIATPANGVGIWGLIGNTLFYSVICSVAQIFVSYSTAYLTAKYRFKFSTIVYSWAVVIMGIPIIGSQTSMITTLQNFGLYSTYLGMIFMSASYAGMYYLVFVAFFEGLPDSYVEAAEVDGSSQFATFIRVIIPLGIKTILTVSLIMAVGRWNDYTMSFLYMPTIPTLAYSIYNVVHEGNAFFPGQVTAQLAGCLITITPLLILFVFAKDKLMGNVSAGGLKG